MAGEGERGGGSGLPIRFGEQKKEEKEEEEEEGEQLAEGKWGGGGHTGAPLSCPWPPMLLATTAHQPTNWDMGHYSE